MPNPMTGAGYGDKKPKPKSPFSPAKPTPTSELGFSKDYGKKASSKDAAPMSRAGTKGMKKVKLGNVETYKGSLYQKRQEAFLKKMKEMNEKSMKPKYKESQLPPRKG